MTTTWTRSAAAVAVLALAIQPCFACLTAGGATAAIAPPSHAPAHGAEDCASGHMTGGDHTAAPEAANACPTLSARVPEAYVPTAAAQILPVATPSVALAAPAPSLEDVPAAPDAIPDDRVPLFLRHASFRI